MAKAAVAMYRTELWATYQICQYSS